MAFVRERTAHIIVVLLLSAAGTAILPAPVGAQSVRWYNNLEEASLAAKESNRPMLVDFWADWCDACKVMEEKVYDQAEFAEAARRFITVRIDYDKKTAIARKYGVEELPTLVFTDSFGGELFWHRGFLDSKMLVELLNSLPEDVSDFNRFSEALARDKNDLPALEEMGKRLRSAGLFLASNTYYERALETKDAKGTPSEREAILNEIGSNSLDVRDGQHAMEIFEKCLKEFPASQRSTKWTLGLGRAYILANKKDNARRTLQHLIRNYPGSEEARAARALLASL
jgi:thiol-disulfide isomerase/thioredoxin